jgi:hypothetical protein
MTHTNIKSLPEGKYFTERGYTQAYPWVQIGETAHTRTLARVNTAPDPEWKPEIIPGGFAGHCTNQRQQTWLFDGVDRGYTLTIRKDKRGQWVHKGVSFKEDQATYFYDYNF